jgi:hypothetical protein
MSASLRTAERSDALVVAIWIGAAFVIGALVTALTRASAMLTGCLLPVAAALLAIVYLMFFVAHVPENSTAPVFIPFAFICTVLGSVPGAFAGLPLRDLISRTKRSRAS